MQNDTSKISFDANVELEGSETEERLIVEVPVEVRAGDWSLLNCIKKLPNVGF